MRCSRKPAACGQRPGVASLYALTHTGLDSLNGARTDTVLRGDPKNSLIALRQCRTDNTLFGRVDLRAPESLPILPSAPKTRADSAYDHSALKLGKGARDLEQQPPHGRRGIDG